MKGNDLLLTKFNNKLIPITRFNRGEASKIFEIRLPQSHWL